MITVAFTVSCQRRAYLDRTLASWRRVRGIGNVQALACLEHYRSFRPGEQAAAKSERQFDNFEQQYPSIRTVRNPSRLGCLANTRQALQLAFSQSDFAVLAEEDIEVADDVLEYFAWARDAYAGDSQVLAVCAHSVWSGGTTAQVARLPWFTPLVWGTWRNRWTDVIAPSWKPFPGHPEGWDATLRTLTEQRGLRSIYPAQSRAQHIGAESTMTPGSPATKSNHFHDRSQSRTYQPHYAPQQYLEVRGLACEYY